MQEWKVGWNLPNSRALDPRPAWLQLDSAGLLALNGFVVVFPSCSTKDVPCSMFQQLSLASIPTVRRSSFFPRFSFDSSSSPRCSKVAAIRAGSSQREFLVSRSSLPAFSFALAAVLLPNDGAREKMGVALFRNV